MDAADVLIATYPFVASDGAALFGIESVVSAVRLVMVEFVLHCEVVVKRVLVALLNV